MSRLADRHAEALEELLLQDVITNLFLLGYLDAVPVSRATWYGILDGDRLVATVLLSPGRLAVPFAPETADAEALGRELGRSHRPCMMVGPREAADALWACWAGRHPVERWHDQLLLKQEDPGAEAPPLPGFRRARAEELAVLARYADAMEEEDIGRRPLQADPVGFLAQVRRRIERGQSWVLEEEGEVRFTINVGTTTPFGVQVGGTYVPPGCRGRGYGRRGMIELGRRLLPKHPRITLHVHGDNTPAVRAYEAAGYRLHTPFRLVTVKESP